MQNIILIILTSHRRDCFRQCIRNLERHTDLAVFSKIYVLANEVEPEHNLLIQDFKRRHPNVRDIHCSPRGLGGCVIVMQNAVLQAHRKSMVVKMDEDLFVTAGWLEGLLNAHQRHAKDPKAIMFSPVVPNNWVGRHCLRSHLIEWYGEDFNERLNTWKPVHTNTEYGVWIWNKVLEDGLEERIRQRAIFTDDFYFDEAFNINCILFDFRLIDLLLPFRENDEVEINASLKPQGYHAIMTLHSVAHHYSFGPQQQGIDEAIGMTRVARYFLESASRAQNITSPIAAGSLMSIPKISVIIPCYNYASYLKECIYSVLANNMEEDSLEIIVVDDGSTDDTAEVAAGFSPRVRYLHQPNAGLSAARNTGMAAASGDYLLFLDADDMLAPNTIQSQAAVLDAHPETDIVVCQTHEALSMAPEAPLAPIGFWLLFRDDLPLHLCHLNIAPPHAFMIRRDRALANGTFDTSLRACEDYDFWFRCAANGMTFLTNTATYVIYRKHAHSMSARKDNQLLHDAVMHTRTARSLAERERGLEGPGLAKWMAHASGCLVTAFRMFVIQVRDIGELFELCLHSVIQATKSWNKRDAPNVITQYYANKLMLHLRLFAQLRNPILQQIETIMAKLYPDLNGSLGAASRRENELIPIVHHPQSYGIHDSSEKAQGGKRILLCSDFFWPSTGGCELFLEDLGSRLVEQGHEVHVATRSLSERNGFKKNGMHIIQFQCSGRFRDAGLGEQYDVYTHFLNNSRYDSIFIIGQPDSWQHAPLLSADSSPNIHLIPIINQELTDDWKRLGQEYLVAAVLRKARNCLSLTESGLDARFVRTVGVTPLFVPHAITPHPPNPGFRARHDLADNTPLIIHVGNFWPVKNQLDLVRTFKKTSGSWTLALIGARLPWPGESAYHDAIAAEAATDPRIRLLGPLPPEEADAAIAEGDILLLSSKAECRPLVILQAMHHGTPWIATPECNSVHDDTGGVVCPLDHFPRIVKTLLNAPQLRVALGTLGREHWRQCFSWDAVLPLFLDLIENGTTERQVTLPQGIRTAQRRITEKIMAGSAKNDEKLKPSSTA